MTTHNQQSWSVRMLAAIAIVIAFTMVILTGAAATPSGSRNEQSPSGGYMSDQSWFLFDGKGATCHVEMWSVNNNRSLHDNTLITVDTNGTTTHMAVERFQGTTDRGLWDSTETGEVYLQLVLGDDQRSSASYHAEWTCKEAPTSTTQPPETTTTGGSTTTSGPPTSTVTTVPESTTTSSTTTTVEICAVSDCNVVDPPTTTTTTASSTTSTTVPSTVPPSTPTGIPTGEGIVATHSYWTPIGVAMAAVIVLTGLATFAYRRQR
jgi:hypothetical protein